MYLSTFDRYPSKQTKVKSFKFQQGHEWLSELEKGGMETWGSGGGWRFQGSLTAANVDAAGPSRGRAK